jgi:amidohydrolase
MNFREAAKQTAGYIIAQRRYFHQHPELSFEEWATTQAIGARLTEMGLEPHYFPNHTGVWAVIEGTKAQGRTVALRADIDALPVEEKTGLPYCSTVPGVMHACGHDCHTAMLLGAAKMLCAHREELAGKVKLLFQGAEESCHGAEFYVQEGFLDGVDAIYGSHVWGDLDAPYLNVEAGARMASCDNFTITVTGASAHGSAPHQGTDAIVAAAAIIMQIQTVVSRLNDPRAPLAVTIGEISGGQRFNIIANHVVMKGTARTHSRETRSKLEGWLRNIVQHTAQANGARAVLEYEYYPAPLINDGALAAIAQKAAVSLYGEQCLAPMEKAMGSEDFSYFTQQVPGVFAFIGIRNVEKGLTAQNHNDHFDVDEEMLPKGAALYAQFAHDYLLNSMERG